MPTCKHRWYNTTKNYKSIKRCLDCRSYQFDPDTNSLTQAVITFLTMRKNFVWRQNNIAAPGRSFTGMAGLPDVIGFDKINGTFIGVEIKTGGDKLSLQQINFAISLIEGNGLWYEARDIDSFTAQIDSCFTLKQQMENSLVYLTEQRNKLLLHEGHKRSRRNKQAAKRGA